MTDSIQTPTEEATTEAYENDYAVIREHVLAGTADQLNLDPHDVDFIARTYKTLDEQMEIANGDNDGAKRRLAENLFLMEEVALILAKDTGRWPAYNLANNPFVTADILEVMANNPSFDCNAKRAVAENPKTKFSTLMRLVFHPDHGVRHAVILSKQWEANLASN